MIRAKLKKGRRCRISFFARIGYREHGGEIMLGDRVSIAHGCVIRTCTGTIRMGNQTRVGYGCIMHGLGGITIGDHVLLSPRVSIYAQNHGIKRDALIAEQEQSALGVAIEDDVWVGANAIILDGVTIRQGAVIGAGAVVTRNVPPYEIWTGNPARRIGKRP